MFKDLIVKLNFLETTGIKVSVNNKIYNIYLCIKINYLRYNLRMHSLLGLVESIVANYHCRFNKAHEKCYHQSITNDHNLSGPVDHTSDDLYNNVSFTGVKELWIRNDVRSFNVTTNYSEDIKRNMLEGMCKYNIGLILKEIIFKIKNFS